MSWQRAAAHGIIRTRGAKTSDESKPKLHRKTGVEADLDAAFRMGQKDFTAGRSLNNPRYGEKSKDEAWKRGWDTAREEKHDRDTAKRS